MSDDHERLADVWLREELSLAHVGLQLLSCACGEEMNQKVPALPGQLADAIVLCGRERNHVARTVSDKIANELQARPRVSHVALLVEAG